VKTLKILTCMLLCALLFSSCSNSKNTEFFKEKLQDAPSELLYIPELIAGCDTPENVRTTAQSKTVTYHLSDEVKGKSGLSYQNMNIHIKLHEENINEAINSLVDSYHSEPGSAVNAVLHESNEKKYAITYEIRPDFDYTVLNVVYSLSYNISATYALQLMGTDDITDKTLDKICKDVEMIIL